MVSSTITDHLVGTGISLTQLSEFLGPPHNSGIHDLESDPETSAIASPSGFSPLFLSPVTSRPSVLIRGQDGMMTIEDLINQSLAVAYDERQPGEASVMKCAVHT